MAQFSVHRNRNARSKNAYPLLVDVQSDLLEDLQTRVVIPLTKASGLTRRPVTHLMPLVDFEDSTYLVMTPQLAGIPRGELGPAIGSLAPSRDIIVAALDFLLTGF